MLSINYSTINTVYKYRKKYNSKTCLEIGCGNGAKSVLLAPMFDKYYRIDANADNEYKLSNMTFQKVSYANFTTKKKFDMIIMIFVFHFLLDEGLDKAISMLNPSGVIIIIEPLPIPVDWRANIVNKGHPEFDEVRWQKKKDILEREKKYLDQYTNISTKTDMQTYVIRIK